MLSIYDMVPNKTLGAEAENLSLRLIQFQLISSAPPILSLSHENLVRIS